MRILLDEDLPSALVSHFRRGGYEVAHVEGLGWEGVTNSQLLRRASGAYDVLVTGDANMPSQQNLARFDFAIVQLRPRRKVIDQLVALVPRALAAIPDRAQGRRDGRLRLVSPRAHAA